MKKCLACGATYPPSTSRCTACAVEPGKGTDCGNVLVDAPQGQVPLHSITFGNGKKFVGHESIAADFTINHLDDPFALQKVG